MALLNRLEDDNLLISPDNGREADLYFKFSNNIQSRVSVRLNK
jgi:hypothetical protein